MTSSDRNHDRALRAAFDGQAVDFESAPVQTDREALARLVAFADLPGGAHVLDCGCGPGLVAEVFLEAGYRVLGVDLSTVMVERARARCARFGDRARFRVGSVFDDVGGEGFDAAISRYVIHHVRDPLAFVRRQAELARPGGVVVASDHTTDPDETRAGWHQEVERLRDHTHTRNLTPGGMVNVFAEAGLGGVELSEEAFELDFDEWFDRGTPSEAKTVARERLLAGAARGFEPRVRDDGGVTIRCWRALVRGEKPDGRGR